MRRNSMFPLLAIAVLSLCPSLNATTILYNDPAAFYAAIGASYTENFNSLTAGQLISGTLSYSENGFGFQVYNTNNITSSTKFLPLNATGTGVSLNPDSPYAIANFEFGSGIYAFGASIWSTDSQGAPRSTSTDVWIGTTKIDEFITSTSNRHFTGIVSTTPISGLTVSTSSGPPGSGNYNFYAIDNVTVANLTPVNPTPEPSTVILLGGALFLLPAVRLYARKRA